MKRALGWMLVVGAALAWGSSPAQNAAGAADKKGTEVSLDSLQSRTPADWKEEAASNKMRAYQFSLPHAKGDDSDAELVIFYFGPGGGGSAADNVKRWKGMFTPPEGKTIDDVAKVEKLKVAGADVTYLDVHGTYRFKFPPFAPNAKEQLKPNYELLGVVFESPKGPYFIRLVGPVKTVEEHKKGFEEWVKGFK